MEILSEWEPPDDPNFDELEDKCRTAWERDKPTHVAFDTETSGFKFDDQAFCVTLAWEGEGHYLELDTKARRQLARTILLSATDLICHNAKFDLIRVINKGLVTADEIFG